MTFTRTTTRLFWAFLTVATVAGAWTLAHGSVGRTLLTVGMIGIAVAVLVVHVQLFRQSFVREPAVTTTSSPTPAKPVPAPVAPPVAVDVRLRDLAEHVPGVVYQFKLRPDGRGHFPYVSPALDELFGLHPTSVQEDGSEVFARMHADDRERVMAGIFGAGRGRSAAWSDEFRVVHPVKGVRWVSGRSTATRDADGAPVWHGVVMDISAVKEAERRAHAATAMLEDAQAMLRLGSWSYDVATGETTWSKQVFRIFGRDESLGSPDYPAPDSYILDEDARCLDDAVKHAISTGTGYSVLLHLRDPHDGVSVVRAEAQAITDDKGATVRLLGTIIDVTATVEREEALRSAQQAAEAANQAKSEFLANMSHEIRTPMTAILGYVDLLSEPDVPRPDHHEYVTTIRRNADHLLQLMNDILDLSKIEAGQMNVERIGCSPAAIARDVVSLLRPRAEEKGLTLELRFEGLIPRGIQSDPTRLRQILVNLVGNAVKFTDQGSIVVTVYFNGSDGEPTVSFEVKDSGIGMTASEQKSLFRPFTQADTSTTRRFGGTGLGLSVAIRLATMLGGTITVQSAPRLGSLFTARVSTGNLDGVEMVGGLAEAGDEVREAEPAANAPKLLAGRRVLLAEDGPDNRRLIALYLNRAGATVELVENGQLAIDRLTQTEAAPFDAVLMDMQMPVLDGYRATSRLRSLGYQGPIIALTAHAMDGDRERCLRAGCDDYATKPINADALVAAIERHINPTGAATPPARAVADAPPTSALPTAAANELFSTYSDDPEMLELIEHFVAMMPERVQAIEKALATDDGVALGRAVHQLRGAGGSFGFGAVTDAATCVEDALHESPPRPAELTRAIASLIAVCRSVRAPRLVVAA